MAHVTIYNKTSKPIKKFRSLNSVDKFLKSVLNSTHDLVFKETLKNYFEIYKDNNKTSYSLQIVE